MRRSVLSRTVTASAALLLPYARRARRELHPHVERVRAAGAELEDAMRQVEARFLAVGAALEQVTDAGGALVREGEAFVALSSDGGADGCVTDPVGRHMWAAIEFVEKNEQAMDELLRRLRAADERIERTLAAEQSLTRALAPLKTLQTLFRVETARLSVGTQEMFLSLVGEIDRISRRIEGAFREKFETVRAIHGILSSTLALMEEEQRNEHAIVADRRKRLTVALESARRNVEESRETAGHLAQISQMVGTETGRIVMALQSQDILSQKLQHVRAVLGEADARFVSLPSDRAEACRTLRYIEQAGRVAAAQLGAMREEILKAQRAIADGLLEVGREMEDVGSDCQALQGTGAEGGVEDAVRTLLESLGDVRRIVREEGEHARDAHRTIEPIGGMASNFTSFMHEFSLEMHLIGLNAEVQAAHVGMGTGLVVLSAHTSEISRETRLLSDALAVDLDALAADLAGILGAFEGVRDESGTFLRTLESEGASHERAMNLYREKALRARDEICRLLPELRTQAKAATEQAAFEELAAGQIAALEEAVANLVEAAALAAGRAGVHVDTEGLIDEFLRGYTMRSEVDIHRQAITGSVPPGRVDILPPSTCDVELFGADEPAQTASSGPVASDVELWGEPDISASPASQSAPANTRFRS